MLFPNQNTPRAEMFRREAPKTALLPDSIFSQTLFSQQTRVRISVALEFHLRPTDPAASREDHLLLVYRRFCEFFFDDT